MMRFLLFSILVFIFGKPVLAQSGEEIFAKNCIACHTIGSGNRVGPDLKGIEDKQSIDWIGEFILSSEKLINSGDKDAIESFEKFNKIKMQNFDFNPGELSELINYIVLTGGGELPAPEAKEFKLTSRYKEKLIPAGSRLFGGIDKFSEGGASCFACHHVNYEGMKQGGSLGSDLTNSFSKYSGALGLMGFIKTPSSPVMEAEYSRHPLSEDEIISLVAFLEVTDGNETTDFDSTILLIGGAIFSCLLIFLIMIIWSEKKLKGVNSKILKRQIKLKYLNQ